MPLHPLPHVYKRVRRLARLSAGAVLMGLLLSCGGGGGTDSPSTPDTPLAAWALRPITDAALTAQFQSALSNSSSTKVLADTTAATASGSGATTSTNASAVAVAFSGTTVQETGVDEADLIKSDGTEVFSVVPGSTPRIERLRIRPDAIDASLQPVQSLASPLRNNASIHGLYLDSARAQLVVLGESGSPGDAYARWFQPLSWVNGATELAFVDTTTTPLSTRYTLGINAQLVSSRRINTTLYLVLRKRAQPAVFDPFWALSAKTSNEQQLDQLKAADLLPSLSINGASAVPLVAPDSCLAPITSAAQASADIMTLVAIQLDTTQPTVAARCFIGSTEAVYLSTANLYLATTRWVYTPGASPDALWYPPDMATDIHQFALDGLAMAYKGSGSVAGHLGFDQNRKSFRMSEHQGVLRVATQTAERWGPAIAVTSALSTASSDAATPTISPVRLSLLKPTANKNLATIATLPNERRPAAIGRPGEQLYASRFVGNRAYLVTYRLTDPLYVLDLSDPTDPQVAAELQVDGYSDYLFPLSERYLLGVGKDAKSDGSAGDGRFAWYQGVKVSVIDVGTPAHPVEVAQHIIGLRGTDATVLHDHHGIALLPNANLNPNTVRVALPIRLHTNTPSYTTGGLSDYYRFTRNQLSRFQIDLTTGALTPSTDLMATDSTTERDLNRDRAWLTSGQVHHYQNGIWQSWRWD